MKTIQLICICLCLTASIASAQIGIGTMTPSNSSALDISSEDKGVLFPRVNLIDLLTFTPIIGTPTAGLVVWNTNLSTGLGLHYWTGSIWLPVSGKTVFAANGLILNTGASADTIQLGGVLTQATTITNGSHNLTFNLDDTGYFAVQDNATTRFSVLDNGRVAVGGVSNAGQFNVTGNSYFSDDIYLRDGAVNGGDVLVRIYDSVDDGIIDIYENNVMNIRLRGNGTSVFNEQGTNTNDFRIESDLSTHQFFIDASTNEIGINTSNPSAQFEMVNRPNFSFESLAKFTNDFNQGNALLVENENASNNYPALAGVTNYTGTNSFLVPGVLGLARSTSLTHEAIGVRGFANGRDGTGVRGSRQTTGSAGWGGTFYNDLGYTGFFGTVSDRKTKKDIVPIQDALHTIKQLNPVSYYFDLEKYPTMGLSETKEYGLIAQEVREILPEITREKSLSTKATVEVKLDQPSESGAENFTVLDYTRLIPILAKGMQEQQEIIEDQEARIKALESKLDQLLESKE